MAEMTQEEASIEALDILVGEWIMTAPTSRDN